MWSWLIHLSLLLLLAFVHNTAAQTLPLPDEPNNTAKPGVILYNTGKTTEGSLYYNNTLKVIEFLYTHNPPNGFATSLGYGDSDTAFGHSACYDMSEQPGCSQCIQHSFKNILQAGPLAVGGVMWINDTTNRCRVRYESYNFTSDLVSLGVLGIVGPNVSEPAPSPLPRNPPPPPPYVKILPQFQNSSSSRAISGGAVGGIVAGGVLLLLVVAGFVTWVWRIKQPKLAGSDFEGPSVEGPVVFKYQDLSRASDNFSEASKLGQGGFGSVYKACLNDGTQVAVKKLSLHSTQGRSEFVNEITMITGIRHRNLVTLKGYCVEGDERLLVYEFYENGSLHQALFGIKKGLFLTWQSRFQIALGVARGLAYLHEESNIRIIHRDIKGSNILLDKTLQPKISDFGISKFFDLEKGFTSTKVAGTLGYMAPEYVTRGKLTSKADVFSYGVLISEIVSGRKCIDPTLPPEEELLMQHVWNLHEAGKLEECIDKRLGKNYATEEVTCLISIAMLCTQEEQDFRPTMSHVVAMLQGYLEIPDVPIQTPTYFARMASTRATITASSFEAR